MLSCVGICSLELGSAYICLLWDARFAVVLLCGYSDSADNIDCSLHCGVGSVDEISGETSFCRVLGSLDGDSDVFFGRGS